MLKRPTTVIDLAPEHPPNSDNAVMTRASFQQHIDLAPLEECAALHAGVRSQMLTDLDQFGHTEYRLGFGRSSLRGRSPHDQLRLKNDVARGQGWALDLLKKNFQSRMPNEAGRLAN